MDRPEKANTNHWYNEGAVGFNKGLRTMELYYKELIKEDYIRKDKLPSVAELAGILDAHRHCSISIKARKVLNEIREGE